MIIKWIEKMFNNAFKKEYYETYWAIDLHGTVIKPDYRIDKIEVEFYPWAKETLQLMTKRDDIIMIMFTSSYPREIEFYNNIFKENDIHFNYINGNPEISSYQGNFGYYVKKFYFNVLMDDHAGFDATTEWEQIYNFLKNQEDTGNLPDKDWTTKF